MVSLPRWAKAVLPLLVLALGIAVAVVLVRTKPQASRAEPAPAVTLVDTVPLRPVTEAVEVRVQGTVIPARSVALAPEVGGRVVWVNPRFTPGGRVYAGESLFKIDQEDYRLALDQAAAAVERAKVDLEMERGRKEVAEKEFDFYAMRGTTAPGETNPLVLREPQLRAMRSALNAARSSLEKAQLALSRTELKAPFNALVQAESVEVGQLVGPGARVATLVGTDEFWVRAAVPIDVLPVIEFPVEDQPGASAVIRQDAGNSTLQWTGHVLRLLGDLDEAGRMARILVAVDDPLRLRGTRANAKREQPLLLGSYVNVSIDAGKLENVFAVPRAALREGDTVYVMDENDRLAVRDIKVAWRRADSVLVSEGLRVGERLVVSRVATPVDGMRLRTGAVFQDNRASRERSR